MMDKRKTVLVVEDDAALMFGLEENLAAEGYAVMKAEDGTQGLKLALDRRIDLLILDLMLPGISGFEVCRGVRAKRPDLPILILTARQEEFDKLLGFDLGADDYVTKPFSIKELMARVRAMLRREESRTARAVPGRYRFGSFTLDSGARTLAQRGKDIPLTRTEFDLLLYFLTHPGQALSREVLLQDVWGTQYFGTQRSLDSFVAMLRGKIEKDLKKPEHILTVHGIGYKFAGEVGKE